MSLSEAHHRPIEPTFNVRLTHIVVDARVWSNTILVDSASWYSMTYFEQEYTLLHEIGHLQFGYEHGDNHIMGGSILRATYEWNSDVWLREFFEVHNQGGT